MAIFSPLSHLIHPSMLRLLRQHPPPDLEGLLQEKQLQRRSFFESLTIPFTPQTSIWRRVHSEVWQQQSNKGSYWWRYSGTVLATLLHEIGCSTVWQVHCLRFFANNIIHSLGGPYTLDGSPPAWHSFMTDDGSPIELSWDWGKGKNSPSSVRYAVEPVSPYSTNSWSTPNIYEAFTFHERVRLAIPSINLVWYDHFHSFFINDCPASNVPSEQGHSTQIFYGFDLKENDATCKTYFFPAYKARAQSRGVLDVISEAISTAPQCSSNIKIGLDIFSSFAAEREDMEIDMLAIDLVAPMSSRIKIYFRLRETTFTSVQAVMTLNERLKSRALDRGLCEIWQLWDAMFEVDGRDDLPLGSTHHRTSGILYYVEFKSQSPVPGVKLYMPVRHYARSDEHIINSLCNYLCKRGKAKQCLSYSRALRSLFSEKSMQLGCGIHTYITCSIQEDGSLRAISYLNPQIDKLNIIP